MTSTSTLTVLSHWLRVAHCEHGLGAKAAVDPER